jgi:hypothetical protein
MSALNEAFKLPVTGIIKTYEDVQLNNYDGLTGSYRPYDVYNMYTRDEVIQRQCMTLDAYENHGLK